MNYVEIQSNSASFTAINSPKLKLNCVAKQQICVSTPWQIC